MSLVSLFFQTKAKLKVLELDCSVNEVHERNATLTQYPVEDGATKTDNAVLLPIKLTMEGIISTSPLGAAGLVGSAVTAIASAANASGAAQKKTQNKALAKAAVTTGVASVGAMVASAAGVGGLEGTNSRKPHDVFAYLESLWLARQPFDVVTALTGIPVNKSTPNGPPVQIGYFNMIITSLSVPRNKDNVNALRFTATLEQVTFVTAQKVTLSQVPSAASSQSLGNQGAKSPAADALAKASSIITNWTGVGQ